MKFIENNIHYIYKTVQLFYGEFNRFLPERLKLSPFVLRIRITNKCNLHCSFCYLSGNLNIGEENHLEMEEWNKIISKLPLWTVVDITGAEPFLAKNFKEILRLILKRGLKVSITTNGQFIDKEFIEEIVSLKMYYLMISIDGMKEYHNSIRGSDKSFQKIEDFLTVLADAKIKANSKYPMVCIKSTITDDNIEELVQLNNYIFENHEIQSHSFNLLFQNQARGGILTEKNIASKKFITGNTQTYKNKSFILKGFKEILLNNKKNKRRINLKPGVPFNEVERYIERPSDFGVPKCNRVHSIQTLYYDGTLTPCDIGLDLGNIREIDYNLRKTWRLKKYKDFLTFFKKSKSFLPACDACCLADQEFKK
ncbi:MAG: MoaA/NifB/PqqE/SkfB family radical SAM enzyme [Bacteriovoracaceae bacterium]|jgi:MoaA/NifB/PqqE/SkfB family radical SAM enzyme